MDEGEFRSASYQRVFQYVRRHIAGSNLDTFSYQNTVEGTTEECVELLLR